MANYTANYGLHQWEPGDSFLRTDFNEDFAVIDAALGRTERSGQANAYNVYNLMLQNYYEGKYTGYKRALLFDGFLDGSGVAEKSAAMTCGGRRLTLTGRAPTRPGSAYGTDYLDLDNQRYTPTYMADGAFHVTGFSLYVANHGSYNPITATLCVNDAQKAETSLTTAVNASGAQNVSWPPVSVAAGDSLYLRVSGNGMYTLRACAGDGFSVGGYFTITAPAAAQRGTAVSVPWEAEGTFDRALAWVRHGGGAVELTLNGAAMEEAGRWETKSLQGAACLETAFRLEGPLAGPVTVSLGLDCRGADSMAVYDYGAVLL